MNTSRGFTLIELLMVVAIIGILSTVILASLTTARLKAADAAVRQEMTQLRTLMEEERTNSGTYTAIKSGGGGTGSGGFIKPSDGCGAFTGQFAEQAASVCAKLLAASATGSGCSATGCVYFANVVTLSPTAFTITAYLPAESANAVAQGCTTNCGRFLCLGSSGTQSISAGGQWLESGCYRSP